MAAGIDGDFAQGPKNLAGERVELRDAVDEIAEKLQPDSPVFLMGRKNVHDVTAHTKRAPVKIDVIALVLNIHQASQNVVARHFHLIVEQHQHAGVVLGRANAIDARHTRHHDDILALQQRARGRMAKFVNVFVNCGVFFDVRIRTRHVGFGLVVIVVADKVLNRIVRKQTDKLIVELCRQRFIGS